MEISLLDIKEHVKKYASAISSLINVDVGRTHKKYGQSHWNWTV